MFARAQTLNTIDAIAIGGRALSLGLLLGLLLLIGYPGARGLVY